MSHESDRLALHWRWSVAAGLLLGLVLGCQSEHQPDPAKAKQEADKLKKMREAERNNKQP